MRLFLLQYVPIYCFPSGSNKPNQPKEKKKSDETIAKAISFFWSERYSWLHLNWSTRDANQNLTDHKKNEMCSIIKIFANFLPDTWSGEKWSKILGKQSTSVKIIVCHHLVNKRSKLKFNRSSKQYQLNQIIVKSFANCLLDSV